MDESPRPTAGKPPRPGRRFKLITVVSVALCAAGYAAIQLSDLRPNRLIAGLAGLNCAAPGTAQHDALSVCAMLKNIGEGVSAVPGATHEQDAYSPGVAATASVLPAADATTRATVRQRHVARATPADLQPGVTLAELCGATADAPEFYCQATPVRRTATAGWRARNEFPSSDEPAFTIAGRVLTADGGDGLGGVPVLAEPADIDTRGRNPARGAPRFRTLTDTDGTYVLTGLPAGDYTLSTSPVEPYRAARITARAGVDYADLIVARNAQTVVEGQVFDADGGVLEGVSVLPLALGQASVLTANDGRFRLPLDLQPAVSAVTLRFQRPGYNESLRTLPLDPALTTVSNPTSVAGVKVVMQPVAAWTSLAGTVRSDAGEPLAGRVVELRPASGPMHRTTTDAAGHYEFPVLESPAAYRLTVLGGTGYRDHQRALQLTADSTEVNVVVDAYEFGAVSGQLVNSSGEPVPDFHLVLRNTGSQKPNAVLSSDASGNFTVPSAPAGEFVIASQASPSILVQGLHLGSGERLNLPLVIDWGTHELRGVVVDAQNRPIPATRVVLEWSHEAAGISTSAVRRTATDTQGQFAFSQLGPGPHSLRVDAPGFRTFAMDHDLSRQGYAVTVQLN